MLWSTRAEIELAYREHVFLLKYTQIILIRILYLGGYANMSSICVIVFYKIPKAKTAMIALLRHYFINKIRVVLQPTTDHL